MIDEYLEKKILSIKNKSDKWPQLKWVSLFSIFFLLLFINLCDLYILPNQSNDDVIVSYRRIYDMNRKKLGYQYFTEDGNKFKIHDSFIRNPIINIKTSILFNTVTHVSNEDKDYSNALFSSRGFMLFLKLLLFVLLGVSIYLLLFKIIISDNILLNIKILNCALIGITILAYYLMS